MNNQNNNNFFNSANNLNTNTTPTPSTPINNLNTIYTQPQINNGVSTTNETQINNQNNNFLSNGSVSEKSQFIQPTVNNPPQQPNINHVNEFNSQINPNAQQKVNNINSIPQNNNINPISQNSFQSNNVNSIPIPQNIGASYQPTNNSASTNDEELLRAFVGNNYEKITTKPFNFAGFFFTTFYMFYRKMFLYAILLFLFNLAILNLIDNFIITLAFNVAVGFLVNKTYLFYAKKKIDKIKFQNQQKDINKLKNLCSAKGGTSIGKIFLGFLAELGITLVVLFVMLITGIGGIVENLFNPNNWNITINGTEINNNETDNSTSTKDNTLIEDVIVRGYSCFGSKCNISIEQSSNYVEYVFGASNIDLFKALDDYSDYVKINIYYTQKDSEKTIVDYKIYLKSNNEKITDIKTEDELRSKIGLYSIGTHNESFTLTEVGMTGSGYKDDKFYTYIDYTLVDSKNNIYEMKYIIPDGSNELNLVEGNTYTITFEVVEDIFGYEFYIKSIN